MLCAFVGLNGYDYLQGYLGIMCVLPVYGRRPCSSVGAAERSSWPAPPAGPALCQDISASTPSGYESPKGETKGHT